MPVVQSPEVSYSASFHFQPTLKLLPFTTKNRPCKHLHTQTTPLAKTRPTHQQWQWAALWIVQSARSTVRQAVRDRRPTRLRTWCRTLQKYVYRVGNACSGTLSHFSYFRKERLIPAYLLASAEVHTYPINMYVDSSRNACNRAVERYPITSGSFIRSGGTTATATAAGTHGIPAQGVANPWRSLEEEYESGRKIPLSGGCRWKELGFGKMELWGFV